MPLSRTCCFDDFPTNGRSVTAWQQALAEMTWECWLQAFHVRTREGSLCVNFVGMPFTAPGPEARYQYRGQPEPPIERAVPAVWGLSVLDHIEAPVRFLSRSRQILRPRGLLFLTFAFWDAEGDDIAAGYETRTRIYDVHSWKKLISEARALGFAPFGGMDWTYHGNTLDDEYSLASLVLTRR